MSILIPRAKIGDIVIIKDSGFLDQIKIIRAWYELENSVWIYMAINKHTRKEDKFTFFEQDIVMNLSTGVNFQ